MCTVLFIPKNNEVYFASLRDENPQRSRAIAPDIQTYGNDSFLAPKDPFASGTWVGTNDFGNTIVLLNGGFKAHKRAQYYRKSRGVIVTELLKKPMPVVEWSIADLSDIEPFTLIVFEDKKLFELVWTGVEKYKKRLDASQPYIWSSSTLYTNSAKRKRAEYFQNWIAMDPPITKLSVLKFFKSLDDSQDGFLINRQEKMKTLSFTFLQLSRLKTCMSYYDLLAYTHSQKEIELKSSVINCMITQQQEPNYE